MKRALMPLEKEEVNTPTNRDWPTSSGRDRVSGHVLPTYVRRGVDESEMARFANPPSRPPSRPSRLDVRDASRLFPAADEPIRRLDVSDGPP
ncbi:hypothetical protein KM043_000365 [Ampulex compressa]|nr:hypothetical protein KM043_000365 [Ampulex compressa]